MDQSEAAIHLIIRKSPFLLISKIILIETLFAFIAFVVITLIDYLTATQSINLLQSIEYEFWLFSLLGITLTVAGVLVFLSWFNEHIHIYPALIVEEKGLFNTVRKEFFLDNFERTEIKQDLFGKIFHYGHVGIVLKDEGTLIFEFITDPQEFVRLIHCALGK